MMSLKNRQAIFHYDHCAFYCILKRTGRKEKEFLTRGSVKGKIGFRVYMYITTKINFHNVSK
jgi:hypothetical protein